MRRRRPKIEPPWYGPVCPVVWEGWRREVSPYPDQRPEAAIRWSPRWTFGIKHATLEAPRQFTPGSASDDRCPYGRQNTETPSCSASTLK